MDIKNGIIILAILLLVVVLARHRRTVLVPLTLAFVISLLWTAYYPYEYVNGNILLLGRINVYPLVLWTAGLTVLQLTYKRIMLKQRRIAIVVLYFALLASLEVVGYHWLNIRLDSNFTSLLNLGVIHAPAPVKIFYVVAGPAYLLILNLLRRIKTI